MLEVGGVIIDDTWFPSISQVVDHILTYPCYEIFGTTAVKPKLRARVRQELAKRTGAKFLKTTIGLWIRDSVSQKRPGLPRLDLARALLSPRPNRGVAHKKRCTNASHR